AIVMSLTGSTAYAGCVGFIWSNNNMDVSLNTLKTIKYATHSEPASCKPTLYKVKISASPSGLKQTNMSCTKIATMYDQTWLMSSKTPFRKTNLLIHKMAVYHHKCPTNGVFIRGYPAVMTYRGPHLVNLLDSTIKVHLPVSLHRRKGEGHGTA
ncbi:hypothetical protein, partial [Acidithiobacillus ferridurans]|uniref:hypothetical protein n=1 Tax=Acidithiobacillus ferridurans TaxID=1232575 RepID=UPI001C074275